jgi:hypothetical protein
MQVVQSLSEGPQPVSLLALATRMPSPRTQPASLSSQMHLARLAAGGSLNVDTDHSLQSTDAVRRLARARLAPLVRERSGSAESAPAVSSPNVDHVAGLFAELDIAENVTNRLDESI